jgi:hypothetical protein
MGDMSLLAELSARVSPDGGEEGLFLAPENTAASTAK